MDVNEIKTKIIINKAIIDFNNKNIVIEAKINNKIYIDIANVRLSIFPKKDILAELKKTIYAMVLNDDNAI